MEIIYRSFDGKEFSTPEDCLTHEKQNPPFRMFDIHGKAVNDPEDCILLQIVDDAKGSAAFIKVCDNHDVSYDGLSVCDGAGWYWWDDTAFCLVDLDLARALKQCEYFDE